MKRRGEITVFLSLTLVCVLSLLLGLLESARTAGARLYLNMAANSAMSSLMSQYNRNLWDMYRLLFLEYESETAICEVFGEYLNFYLDQENLYPMKNQEIRVTEIETMSENGGMALEEEILSYVRYRLPDLAADIAGIMRDAKKAAQAGDLKEVISVCRETGKETRKLERIRKSLEQVLDEMGALKEKAEAAAAGHRKRSFRISCSGLLTKIKRFSDLTDQYEAQIKKISDNRENAGKQIQRGEDGTGEGGMESGDILAAEISACESVERSANEELIRYREMEEVLETSRVCLEALMESLEEAEDMEDPEDTDNTESGSESLEEEPDWESISECMESIEIPEPSEKTDVDEEKAEALERLERVLEGDLLRLVLPAGVKISEKKVAVEGKAVSGTGDTGETGDIRQGKNALDQFLVGEYIILFFDSFVGECESRKAVPDQPLQYEQEYLICGEKSDRENLSGTVEQLLMIRGAMNLLYLVNSGSKREQADGLALAVSGGNAPVKLILSFFIMALWAFGEAVMDVRILLDHGKVEFWKDDVTWRVGLEGLLSLEFLDENEGKSETGSDYEDYIRILLFLKDRTGRNLRMMDVIQWNMRKEQKDFSVADCAYRIELEADVQQRHLFLTKSSYDGRIHTAWSY